MQEWKTPTQVTNNVKILFPEIDAVEVSRELSVVSVTIGRDVLTFEPPLEVGEWESDKIKGLTLRMEEYFRRGISRSELVWAQVKIVTWFIFYTLQVELCFIEGHHFTSLKAQFQKIIDEIVKEIRYDIKQHHKQYELTQLTMFTHHIEHLRWVKSVEDFEWTSSLRYYEKGRAVLVCQHDAAHTYGSELKHPENVVPSFALSTHLAHALPSYTQHHQTSAYLLAEPYLFVDKLEDYGFGGIFVLVLGLIKKHNYYLSFEVNPRNIRAINGLHKAIFEMEYRNPSLNEQEGIRMPVLLQYGAV